MNQLNILQDKDKYDDSKDKLKTIVISKKNYDRLKEFGFCGVQIQEGRVKKSAHRFIE